MTSPKSKTRKKNMVPSSAALLAILAALAVGATPAAASHVSSHADITVVFTPDGMGFEANSTKGLSNIYVEYCDGTLHKHESEFSGEAEIKVFNHTENQTILSVYVKSGDNGIEGNDPPGAGERFLNTEADCDPPTTTGTTTPPLTTTSEIPFFPSAAALVVGTLGALGGAFMVMKRRK